MCQFSLLKQKTKKKKKKKKFRGIEDNEIRQKCSKLKKVAKT